MKTELSYYNVVHGLLYMDVQRALVRLNIAKMEKKTVIYFMDIIIIMCLISLYVVE